MTTHPLMMHIPKMQSKHFMNMIMILKEPSTPQLMASEMVTIKIYPMYQAKEFIIAKKDSHGEAAPCKCFIYAESVFEKWRTCKIKKTV